MLLYMIFAPSIYFCQLSPEFIHLYQFSFRAMLDLQLYISCCSSFPYMHLITLASASSLS
ncbi:hypothetical protein V6Z11_D09G134800 [Gossypium hirsutum]